MQNDAEFAGKVNRYMGAEGGYDGSTQVYHFLELLRDVVGFDKVKEKVVNPLNGEKIAAYYGCLLLRPGSVMQMDDPENPKIIEDLIRALGGEPVIYNMRNECCGAYAIMEDGDFAARKSENIVSNAQSFGAQRMVTACPLCKYNLERNGSDLPVVYFTELLAQALGVKEDAK
jgi:heterodisulfide reductase subunit B